MRSIVRYGQENWEYVGLAVLTVGWIVWNGWIGLATAPFAIVLFVLDKRDVEPDALCAKCAHRKDDHNGNCQECLREQVRGELARDVPCSRFARATRPQVPAAL